MATTKAVTRLKIRLQGIEVIIPCYRDLVRGLRRWGSGDAIHRLETLRNHVRVARATGCNSACFDLASVLALGPGLQDGRVGNRKGEPVHRRFDPTAVRQEKRYHTHVVVG